MNDIDRAQDAVASEQARTSAALLIQAEIQAGKERRDTHRFIVTTIIGAVAAVASVIAATASVISCLS